MEPALKVPESRPTSAAHAQGALDAITLTRFTRKDGHVYVYVCVR